jgi:uncharacterized protein DUF1592/uncharacterized protein DUF1588/uncharacterized protein DUF1595/uncharacterized protein DUF1585
MAGSQGEGKKAAAVATPASIDTGPQAASTAHVRLLSQDQYFNSIGYIFGPDIRVAAHFAPFRRTQGLLEIGASSAGVTTGQIEEFQRTAASIAEQVVSPEHREFLVPCTPKDATHPDRKCATEFLSSVGRLLYRRPLSAEELAATLAKADEAATRLKDFYAGLSASLEGMLISPDVLFVVDKAEPDPQHPGLQRLGAYSLATRLSLFLWNAAPDDQLLQQAQRGDLYTVAGRARAVDRMLASPRLETGVRAFFDDMLGFDDFANLSKDPNIYPAFSGVTVQDAREQTLRTIVNHLLVKKGDYRDLFTTRDTFISPALGEVYGVPAPPGWSEYQFPANSPRAGLLTQISFLAAHAHPGRSSPTLRGKALRELLLCEVVPRPPPNVDFSKVENPDPSLKTMRQRLTAHRSNPVCAGCHRITDPIGLSLENFDGAGEFRDTEHGATIDASGSLDGHDFTSPQGLAQALHDDPAAPACLVQRLYGYAVGGLEKSDTQVMLPYLKQTFAQQGYRLPDLMRTIALSNAFAEVTAPPSTIPSTAEGQHVGTTSAK